MNRCELIGNLTKDPQIKCTQNGKTVAFFTIAVNDGYGENKKTYFLPIVVWGKAAESCGNILKKGFKVGISGKLTTRSYDKDGQTHYVTEVVADMYGGVEFLDKKQQVSPMDEEIIPF